MSRIFTIIGKSATGKDTIYKRVLSATKQPLKTIVSYTTRPIRAGETDGVEYYFVSVEEFHRLCSCGRVIEHRCYHTVLGDWFYFSVDDGQINLEENDYLLIMTLEGYEQLRNYYGNEHIVPIYIEVDAYERLARSLAREKQQANPKYAELCRRYLADEADFSEENIVRLGIKKRYHNDDIACCTSDIVHDIDAYL